MEWRGITPMHSTFQPLYTLSIPRHVGTSSHWDHWNCIWLAVPGVWGGTPASVVMGGVGLGSASHRYSVGATESRHNRLRSRYGVDPLSLRSQQGVVGRVRAQQCGVTTKSRAGGMEDHFSWEPVPRRCDVARGLRHQGWWGGSGRGDQHSRYIIS